MQIKTKHFQRLALAGQWNNTVAGNYSGPAFAMFAHLAKGFTRGPDQDTVFAEVTEADYTGYAPQAVVPPNDTYDSGGEVIGVTGMLKWAPSGSAVGNLIQGIVYTDNAVGGNVLGVDVLDDAIPMEAATDGFASVAVVDLPYGSEGEPARIIQ